MVALIHGQSDYCPVDPIESEALPTNVLSCGARVKLKGPAVSEQAGPPPAPRRAAHIDRFVRDDLIDLDLLLTTARLGWQISQMISVASQQTPLSYLLSCASFHLYA